MSENQNLNHKITRRAGTVAFFTALSRVAGLARDLVIVHLFGASGITDSFFIAFTIPNMMRRLFGEGALTVAFVPVYTDVLNKKEDSNKFISAVLGILICLLIILVILGVIFSKSLVLMLASGFADEPDKLALTSSLTKFLFPYIFFISLVALAMGILNTHKRFAAPAAAPILLNFSMIACTLLFFNYFENININPIYSLALGVLLGGVLQLALQIPSLRKERILLKPSFNLKANFKLEPVRKLGKILIPALFGVAVYQVNILILRQLASYLPAGQISHYYNADRLMQLALGIFALSIATAALPSMSKQRVHNNIKGLADTWLFTSKLTNFITIPAAFGLAFCATPIVSVLYFHGAYDASDVMHTAYATMGFAPGLVAIALTRTTVQGFYAFEDMKTPVYVGVLTVIINLVFGLYLLKYQVLGLALSLSLSSIFQAVLLIYLFNLKIKKSNQELKLANFLRSFLTQTVLAFISVGIIYYYLRLGAWSLGFNISNLGVLVSGVALGIVIYFILARIFKLPETAILLKVIKK